MKRLIVLFSVLWLFTACNDSNNVEIYNENNTSVVNGVVYDIDEKPINGLYKTYYSNGNVRMEVASKNGKPDGNGKFYDEEGVLMYEGTFKEGVLDGALFNYYSDGSVHNELHYTEGQLDGEQKTYDEKHNMIVKAVFEKGNAVSGFAVIDEKKVVLTEEELQQLQ